MNQLIKYWLVGIAIIVVLFLSFSPPSMWYLYIDGILTNPLLISLQQSAFLILGGAVLGSSMLITKEMFT